jgi:hypothetical protein
MSDYVANRRETDESNSVPLAHTVSSEPMGDNNGIASMALKKAGYGGLGTGG